MCHLTLTYLPEDISHGELHASMESAGFSGKGSAWFNVEQLHSFCAALGAYPLPASTPPSLNGGIWNDDGQVLVQTQVGITIAPYGTKGGIIVSAELSAPIWEIDDGRMHSAVRSHFRTDYPSLDRFRNALIGVLANEADTAMLHGD